MAALCCDFCQLPCDFCHLPIDHPSPCNSWFLFTFNCISIKLCYYCLNRRCVGCVALAFKVGKFNLYPLTHFLVEDVLITSPLVHKRIEFLSFTVRHLDFSLGLSCEAAGC